MATAKVPFPKLKNESNYTIWATRAQSLLIKERYITSLDDIVWRETPLGPLVAKIPSEERIARDSQGLATLNLIVKDSPLHQIKNAKILSET